MLWKQNDNIGNVGGYKNGRKTREQAAAFSVLFRTEKKSHIKAAGNNLKLGPIFIYYKQYT